MLSGGDSRALLDDRAVDAEFWALVCQDEEWLRAEFDSIVSEPAEIPARPSVRRGVVGAQPGRWTGHRGMPGPIRRWRANVRPGRGWRRERSPPPEGRWPVVDVGLSMTSCETWKGW
jgi:hypothetical protein